MLRNEMTASPFIKGGGTQPTRDTVPAKSSTGHELPGGGFTQLMSPHLTLQARHRHSMVVAQTRAAKSGTASDARKYM